MKVDIKLIEHVADLARLNLTDNEKKNLVKDLKEILDAFSAIDKVRVKDKASFHPVELKNQVREDLVEKSLTQEEALANTENKKDGYFKGPRAV